MSSINYNYLKRLVSESIEHELNLTHIIRSICYGEFEYEYDLANRLLSTSLRRRTKGFIRVCKIDFKDLSQQLGLRQEYLVVVYATITLADEREIKIIGEINWDFRFNRTLRSVSFHRVERK